jgi:hypothetical protein
MPDARSTRSLVRKVESTRVSHHRHTGETRHSLRDGFNGFLRALPSDRALLSLSPAQCASIVANLTPASGRQDHTTSPSAASSLVRTALPRDDAAASTASHPNVRDDRDTSLSRDGLARDKPVIWVKWEEGYF